MELRPRVRSPDVCLEHKKGGRNRPPSDADWNIRLLRADGERGAREADAQGDQHDRHDAVEETFEAVETSERHDTHLPSWNPRGSEGLAI